jgi:hypothetical protein
METARTLRAAARGAALALLLAAAAAGAAAGTIGPAALRARHGSLQQQLAHNAFGGPIVLQSEEASGRIQGEVYAVLDHPFATVRDALADSAQWCDVLILHLNTKFCRRSQEGGATRIELRVGKKGEQAVQSASLLAFVWRTGAVRADYLATEMDAGDGPFDTRDYELLVEAVPLDAGRTFLRMAYGFSHGGASRFAMQLYLASAGRDKVGFSRGTGDEPYVGGMRGVVERNTMRYYLAIDAYLQSLALPPEARLEKRLQAWFDATERYPRQLHEVDRDAYLRMKRNEVRRQAAGGGR